jgi:DNA polymerase-1
MEDSRVKQKNRLVLIDGHSILFRAFHAYPLLTTKSGELVNAVYGFTNILLTVIKDLEPTHIAVSFDLAEPTFRHEEYEGYKASRPEAPEELVSQMDRVKQVVEVINIPIFEKVGFEADDVIGTLARKATVSKIQKSSSTSRYGKSKSQIPNLEVVVVTGDRDAFQLVDERVKVYMPARGKQSSKIWDAADVREFYGLEPEQLIDFKALAGDPSDEIPGIRGIGPKTATKLLQKYSTLEKVYKNLSSIKVDFGEAVFKKIQDGKKSAKMSKKLAKIVTNVPIKLSLKACIVHDYDKSKTLEMFKKLEFKSLIGKLPNDSFEQMVQEELFSK